MTIIIEGQRKSSLNWVTTMVAFRIVLQYHLWMAFQSSNFHELFIRHIPSIHLWWWMVHRDVSWPLVGCMTRTHESVAGHPLQHLAGCRLDKNGFSQTFPKTPLIHPSKRTMNKGTFMRKLSSAKEGPGSWTYLYQTIIRSIVVVW